MVKNPTGIAVIGSPRILLDEVHRAGESFARIQSPRGEGDGPLLEFGRGKGAPVEVIAPCPGGGFVEPFVIMEARNVTSARELQRLGDSRKDWREGGPVAKGLGLGVETSTAPGGTRTSKIG